ncbi:hypothetical protein FAR02_28305 [Klebsiella pneumoniae subsp. pneumoniae]|nr:hypothetical protein FAR02_28305 [Klebsiella pneumoniae subsp. pneumoniae]
MPAPGGTGCFWHVGCLPLKYLTLPESGGVPAPPAAFLRAWLGRGSSPPGFSQCIFNLKKP